MLFKGAESDILNPEVSSLGQSGTPVRLYISAARWRELLLHRGEIEEAVTGVMNDKGIYYTLNLGGDVYLKIESRSRWIDIRKWWNPGQAVLTTVSDAFKEKPSRHDIPANMSATRRGISLSFAEYDECMKHSERMIHDMKISLA